MPNMQAKRNGVSQSVALAEAYASAPAAEVELTTVSIHHPTFVEDNTDIPAPIYIVKANEKLIATLEATAPSNAGQAVEFQPIDFKFVMPEENDTAAPAEITFTIENASREIQKHMEHARDSDTFVTVMVRTYLASDTSAPHESPVPTFIMRVVEVTPTLVTVTAGFGSMINESFPKSMFTRYTNPGLVSG